MTTPSPARPSASVVVTREGETGPEILLVRRRAGDAFGDSYAFPGGVVDHDESNAYFLCRGRSSQEADEILGIPGGLDYYSAAIRELFEETGILLVRDTGEKLLGDCSGFAAQRLAVDKGELAWSAFLRHQGLCMAIDALYYFAYWETPFVRPKRWTTRFFVAVLPEGQSASHDGSETTDSCWITAANALSLGKQGKLPMPFPTIRILKNLAPFGTVTELLRWAKGRPAEGISKIRPAEGTKDGKPIILLPGDHGYEEADQLWHKT